MNWPMSCSNNQRATSAGVGSPSHDDFLPSLETSLSIDKIKKSPTKSHDEYEDETRLVITPASYPYHHHTQELSLPSPSCTPNLSPHGEHDEKDFDSNTSPFRKTAPHCVSPASHIGGILDSPVLHMHLRVPISPPPTLPTFTADLPSNKEDQASPPDNVFTPSLLELYMGDRDLHGLTLDQCNQPELALWNAHLLSPLSPQSTDGITYLCTSPQLSGGPSALSPCEGSDRFTEPFPPFGFDPLDLNSLLLDQEAMPSTMSSTLDMLDEAKCSWMPHSLYSPLDHIDTARCTGETTTPHSSYSQNLSGPLCHHQAQDWDHVQRHLSYPSPEFSPDQPMESALPHPSPPLVRRYIELDDLKDREHIYDGLSALASGSNQSAEHFNSYDDHYDYEYDADALGSQSPSMRNFMLPELEADAEMEITSDSGLGLSLTSLPTSSDLLTSPSSSVQSLPTQACSSSASSSTTLLELPQWGSEPDTSKSASSVELGIFESDDQFDSHNTKSSNFLLLDMDIHSSPPSQTHTLYPDRLPSPNTLIESLDSRLSHFPLDSSCTNIFSDADCPEYKVLRANPGLYQDLLQLLALRRKAQTVERNAKRKEQELEAEVDVMRIGRTGTDARLPPPSLAVAQAEKAEARSARKREKERCREIASMVALTLFGGGGNGTESNVNVKSSDDDAAANIDSMDFGQTFLMKTGASQFIKGSNERKKKKKRVSLVSMAQLVARMILRRRDNSCSPSSFSGPVSHQPLFSPPGVGPRHYAKSPLWQSTTIGYNEEVRCEDVNMGLGVEGGVVEKDKGEIDNDDLGVGLRLKGFGDFGDGPEWPMM
ncbi:hypothetical protein F5890DRAFT_541692 [Lentinula detonsa]|uniref:Uncharacterized protein n=1 Tax=Lentinula detonsa TaxID=2804962 RepID=A0AA38PTL9_9AGAR|nr:hypothetical protein F5890DRAFT_541692 [Lentinula detonsa]